VKRGGPGSFDFAAYLEAKYAIDSASLNAPLYARFRDHLRRTPDPHILDLGTGTGAMLRRILELGLPGSMRLIGLDQEERNLAAGVDRIEQVLLDRGYSIGEKRRSPEVKSIRGEKGGREIRIDFQQGDLLDRRTTDKLETFDFITAHAFMDLMPLKRAVGVIRGGGLRASAASDLQPLHGEQAERRQENGRVPQRQALVPGVAGGGLCDTGDRLERLDCISIRGCVC
jgi:SAM-dependent methyltransferase